MRIQAFIKKCHSSGVFKMLSIYAVSSWILLQLTAVTSQPLGFPEKSVTYLILVLLLGFPLYIFYVWKAYVVPADKNVSLEEKEEEAINKKGFNKIYFSSLGVITTICLVAIFLIIDKNFKNTSPEIATVTYSDKIAVLQFGNNTGDASYDIISKMAADWIMHGITKNNAGQVISSDVVEEYANALRTKTSGDDNALAMKYLKPGKVISGNFYLKDNKLLFQSVIKDGKSDESLIAFKTNECNKEDALACIDDLKESILGFLVTKDRSREVLQEIPKYDAYKYVLEAKSTSDNEKHISLLNNAIKADPDYFEPQVLRVAYYYNIGNYATADSLLKTITPDSRTNTRQLNILNTYKALLAGNNRRVYATVMEEYAIAPFDLQSNKSAMAVALQFVNRPEMVTSIFNAIPMDSLDLQNCRDCMLRLYVKALADVELKKYNQVIQELEPVLEITEESLLHKPLIASYVRSENHGKVSEFVDKFQILNRMDSFVDLCLYAANEYLLLQDFPNANVYLDKVINATTTSSEDIHARAQAFYLKKEYKEAAKLLEALQAKDLENSKQLAQLAICHLKLNNTAKVNKYLELLEALRGPYQFGSIEYALARFYAAKGDTTQLENHLKRAVAEGYIYTNTGFQNDSHFIKYKNTPFFNSILTYWH